MKGERLRAAFVGCGGIAEHYLRVYRDFEGAYVVTCIDPDLQRAEHAATLATNVEQGKAQPRVTADFSDALAADVEEGENMVAMIYNPANMKALHTNGEIFTYDNPENFTDSIRLTLIAYPKFVSGDKFLNNKQSIILLQ